MTHEPGTNHKIGDKTFQRVIDHRTDPYYVCAGRPSPSGQGRLVPKPGAGRAGNLLEVPIPTMTDINQNQRRKRQVRQLFR